MEMEPFYNKLKKKNEPTWNNKLIYILHLVGYFHSCITMRGFMNVKLRFVMNVKLRFVMNVKLKFVLQGWTKKNCLSESKEVRKCRQSATLKAHSLCHRF